MRPLPPSHAGALAPARAADQNKRLRRHEGVILPSPRTYRNFVNGAIGTSSGAAVTLGTLPIWLAPHETLGIFAAVDARAQTATGNPTFRLAMSASGAPFGGLTLLDSGVVPTGTLGTGYATYQSNSDPVDYPTAFVNNALFPGALVWQHAYRNWTSQIVEGPSDPTEYTLTFTATRTAGSVTLQFGWFRVWAMIL